MSPRETVLAWVDAFNRADVDALAALYHADAINHQKPCSRPRGYSSNVQGRI
jgi:ketosteroid isomerase-like protein